MVVTDSQDNTEVAHSYHKIYCDFQQCGILISVDSDEPVQSPVKLRNSKCCSVSSLTLI